MRVRYFISNSTEKRMFVHLQYARTQLAAMFLVVGV